MRLLGVLLSSALVWAGVFGYPSPQNDAPGIPGFIEFPSNETLDVEIELSSNETSLELHSNETSVELPSNETSVELPSNETSVELPSNETSLELRNGQENRTEHELEENELRVIDSLPIPYPTPEDEKEFLDADKLREVVKELAVSISDDFNPTAAIRKLEDTYSQIEGSIKQHEKKIEQETQKLELLRLLGKKVNEIKTKLLHLRRELDTLANGDTGNSSASEPVVSRPVLAWATLYRRRGQSGRTEILDFRQCNTNELCCKNIQDLDDDTQSINTHDTCVKMFKDRNCSGDYVKYYPGSPDHGDFGGYNDEFSSGQPC